MPISKSKNNVIGITMGDPFGIGPEVIAKAMNLPKIRRRAHFFLIGDRRILQKYLKKSYANITFIETSAIPSKYWSIGKVTAIGAQSSLAALDTGIELLKNKKINSLVTAPVCKESISRIYKNFHGHTEYLAEMFSVKSVEMMFVTPQLKTVIITRHVPIKDISRQVTRKRIVTSLTLTNNALKHLFKTRKPRLAVCGLNPHAGEGGTLGREELTTIIPAIKEARTKRINAHGPFAADTLFVPETGKNYDAVIAMYHDQGLIPVKTLSFKKVVNLTIGLPFIRTSPSHGTAFDIAGKNKADASSMVEAIKLAAQLSS